MRDATVRRLGDDEWTTLRDVRLELLRDSPDAFGATYAEESVDDEATWRRRLSEHAWFIALDGADPVGVAAGGQLREPDPRVRTLRSMWVVPPRRGDGTAATLVDYVVAWAREDGAEVLSLWVTERARRARRFYERYGFVATEDVRQLDARPHLAMTRYELALVGP